MVEDGPSFNVWHYRLAWFLVIMQSLFLVVLIGSVIMAVLVVGPTVQQLSGVLRDNIVAVDKELTETVNILDDYPGYELNFTINERVDLSDLPNSEIADTLLVPVNEVLELKTQLPYKDTLTIPIDTVIPLSDVFSLPVGPAIIQVPLNLQVPFKFTAQVPIDTVIELDEKIPIEFVQEVPLNFSVPMLDYDRNTLYMDIAIPVNQNIPMDVMLDELGMVSMLHSLQTLNRTLVNSLELAGFEVELPE